MIRAHGTTTGTATTAGSVQGTGNQAGHMATFSTSTRNYTDAARAAAPPHKRFNGIVLIVIGVVVGAVLGSIGNALAAGAPSDDSAPYIVFGVVVGLVIAIIGVLVAMRESGYNRDVFPDAYARWDRSWQCQRCGRVFVV